MPSPLWMGLIQFVGGLNRTKKWDKEEFTPSACFEAETSVFYTGFPGYPCGRWQIIDLLSLHNHGNQFLIKNVFIYTYISYWFCSLEHPNIGMECWSRVSRCVILELVFGQLSFLIISSIFHKWSIKILDFQRAICVT